jgi:ADP-heptose:LPS heptosyltransferase
LSENISKSEIDWSRVKRVLVVRLRSIGDAVLSTSSLIALRRFLPAAQIDILLEDWVAPVLDGFDVVDNVLTVSRKDKNSRIETAWQIRCNRYDVAFNLHGGTTATFFVRASGAKYRVGLANYQYSFLYTHLAPSPLEFWRTEHAHSAEQQLTLLGFVGVPVSDRPKSRLTVTEKARQSIEAKLKAISAAEMHKSVEKISPSFSQISRETSTQFFAESPRFGENFALIHPTAAFETKQWATENFARVGEFLREKDLPTIAVATKNERRVLETLRKTSRAPITIFDDLTLPEITALASQAKIFVGNDSGIAHIAAAVETPSVVIFGASNPNHWRPWTNAPNEIVYANEPCSHPLDEIRKGSENPKCIRCVEVKEVCEAIESVLRDEISVAEKRGKKLS